MHPKRALSAWGLCCAIACPVAGATGFQCTYLPDAKASDWSWPTGLNDAGTVVGAGSVNDTDFGALQWDATGLASLGSMYVATAINSKGWVSGFVRDRHENYRPALWKKGKVTTLPTLPGNPFDAEATSLNDDGLVIGYSEIAAAAQGPLSEPVYKHAVLWNGGQAIDLGTLALPERQSVSTSKALDINKAGLIVGYSNTYRFNPRWAVSWTQAGGIVKLRSVPSAVESEASAVNDRGTIVGHFLDGVTIRPVVWKGKRPQELAVATGLAGGYALDVNDADQIVGVSVTPTNHIVAAWWPGVDSLGQDLNTLVQAGGCTNDAGVAYTLTNAVGINRDGVIVAYGQQGENSNTRGAFRLTPN